MPGEPVIGTHLYVATLLKRVTLDANVNLVTGLKLLNSLRQLELRYDHVKAFVDDPGETVLHIVIRELVDNGFVFWSHVIDNSPSPTSIIY